MTDASDGQRDFFVSFNQADRTWATWVAWVLEGGGTFFGLGYTVRLIS